MDVCIDSKATTEAAKYIPRVENINTRAEYYMRLGYAGSGDDIGGVFLGLIYFNLDCSKRRQRLP